MWFITNIRKNIKKTLAKNNRNIINVIIIVLLLLLLLKILDSGAANSIEKREEEKQKIRGYLSTEELSKLEDTAELFIENCKSSENKAYDMLTDICKERIYNTEQTFKEDYCNVYFKEGVSYSKKFLRVFKGVSIYEIDILYSSIEEGIVKEYKEIISVSTDNKKINVNGFIKADQINKSFENNKINICINDCLKYTDHIVYNMTINNKSDEDITIDSKNIICQDDYLKIYKVEQLIEEEEKKINKNEIKDIQLKIKKDIYDEATINKITINGINSFQGSIEINL